MFVCESFTMLQPCVRTALYDDTEATRVSCHDMMMHVMFVKDELPAVVEACK